MKTEEAIDLMSSMYLERIIRSYLKDIPRKSEEGYREQLRNDIEELSNIESIERRYREFYLDNRDPYSKKLLASIILQTLLSQNENCSTENRLVEDVIKREGEIKELASNPDNFRHIEDRSRDIFESILALALEDNTITKDELSLITKLRHKLRLTENDQYLIQAKLNLFPSKDGIQHTRNEVKNEVTELQKAGFVFFCNQPEGKKEPFYVIPEELVAGIKSALNIQLIESKYRLLLNNLKNNQLSNILSSHQLPQYGSKEELIERIIRVGIQPSETLNLLSINDLQNLCDKLPGLKKTGLKQQKIDELIEYFDRLINKEETHEITKEEMYYRYLEQLASKDEQNLMAKKIIKKGKDIDNAFEIGTRYLFQNIFNLELIKEAGSEHGDGCIRFDKKGGLFMWDNKSKLKDSPYDFPEKEYTQFKRYIRNAANKGDIVRCFLIISHKIDQKSDRNAQRLKAECGSDTDIALISAEDLKMIAEKWNQAKELKPFDLQVFNITGILTREVLKKRMDWIAGIKI